MKGNLRCIARIYKLSRIFTFWTIFLSKTCRDTAQCVYNAQKHTSSRSIKWQSDVHCSVGCIKPIRQQVTISDKLYTVTRIMAPHRMKAKRASSFVAKSPFHPRRSKQQPIFPVPVNALEIEFTDPKTTQKSNPATTNIILEKIGT